MVAVLPEPFSPSSPKSPLASQSLQSSDAIWTLPVRCAKLMQTHREDLMDTSRLLTVICGAALAIALQAGAARAELKKQWIDYKDGDKPLSGYLVYDDAISGRRAGARVAHSRAGMSEATPRDSDMIAKMSYVVFAANIFGKRALP